MTLSGNNGFSGGVNVGSGSVVAVASNSGLGSGTVTLSGGNLNFTQGSAISLNMASTTATNSTAVNALSATLPAGVTSVDYNWNNLTVVRPTNGPTGSPTPAGGTLAAGSTVSPLALLDSTGTASGSISHGLVGRQRLCRGRQPQWLVPNAFELAELIPLPASQRHDQQHSLFAVRGLSVLLQQPGLIQCGERLW